MNTVLLPFSAQRRLAEELAPLLDARLGHLDWRRFPDGESLVTIDEALQGADAVLLSSLNQPDALAEWLIENGARFEYDPERHLPVASHV